jgi:hypothetical protein
MFFFLKKNVWNTFSMHELVIFKSQSVFKLQQRVGRQESTAGWFRARSSLSLRHARDHHQPMLT